MSIGKCIDGQAVGFYSNVGISGNMIWIRVEHRAGMDLTLTFDTAMARDIGNLMIQEADKCDQLWAHLRNFKPISDEEYAEREKNRHPRHPADSQGAPGEG